MPVRIAFYLVVVTAIAGCTTRPSTRWYRGNLHTHSLWSDGDAFPEVIAKWYKDNGYHFLAISDHNVLAEGDTWFDVGSRSYGIAALEQYRALVADAEHDDGFELNVDSTWIESDLVDDTLRVRLKTLEEYAPLFDEPGRFVVIQAEEITDRYDVFPVHVNATNLESLILPRGGSSVREVLQNNVGAVLEQRERTGRPMIPHVNHPNFQWGVSLDDLVAVANEQFFEVYNGHRDVRNEGDSLHVGTERMWDVVLTLRLESGGLPFFGIAVDDAHNYRPAEEVRANAGRGWVVVRSHELTAEALIAGMEKGDFYASSGVTLEDVRFDGKTLSIDIRSEPAVTYTTQFVGTQVGYSEAEDLEDGYSGHIGVVLSEQQGLQPTYTLSGDELYVRARVTSSRLKDNPYREGEFESAWVQPVVGAVDAAGIR